MTNFLHGAHIIYLGMKYKWQSNSRNLASNFSEFYLFFKYLEGLQGGSLNLIYWAQCRGNQVLSAGFILKFVGQDTLPLEALHCKLSELRLINFSSLVRFLNEAC